MMTSETEEEDEVLDNILSAVVYISSSFREPVEAKGVNVHSL